MESTVYFPIFVIAPVRPFRITYHTDGTEAAVAARTNVLPVPADTANTGFCLNYEEKWGKQHDLWISYFAKQNPK